MGGRPRRWGQGPQLREPIPPGAQQEPLSQGSLIQSERGDSVEMPTRLLSGSAAGVEHRRPLPFGDAGDLVLLERIRGQGGDLVPGERLRRVHRVLSCPCPDDGIVPILGVKDPATPPVEDVLRSERRTAVGEGVLEVLAQRDKRVDGQGGFDGGGPDWFSATVRSDMEADRSGEGKRGTRCRGASTVRSPESDTSEPTDSDEAPEDPDGPRHPARRVV